MNVKKILILFPLACTTLLAQVPPPGGLPSPVLVPAPASRDPMTGAAAGAAPVMHDTNTVVFTPKINRFNLSDAELDHVYGAKEINFKEMKLDEFLQIYAETVNRTVLRPGTLPAPTITLVNQTPITRREAIQLLDAVLGINGIATVPVGDKFMKVVPLQEAGAAGGGLEHGEAKDLPELGPYITHVVQLKFIKTEEALKVIQPFAKIQNSILPIESNGILVIRDFSENVKRMLEMLAQVDVNVPAEFISEVIPIKYALAGDIASALNSLGGGGGGTTISGGSSSRSSSRGAGSSRGGMGGGFGSGGGLGVQSGGAYPGSGQGSGGVLGNQGNNQPTFTDRLRNIISKASENKSGGGGAGDIQIFGQTKIIADERTNSLLIYATREDMKTIKDVIDKLDVVLAQVLIESIILGVSGDNSLELGVSASQSPKNIGNNAQGAGVMNNSKDAIGTGNNWFANVVSSNAASAVPALSGLNYFGKINKDWDVAIKALATSGKTEVLQRPTIMTTHATPGQFFVGSTVPYVTSSYYGGYGGYGPSSSYQQLRVGIQLTVTPFINPDGIVVMKIDQAIEELDGATEIQGVGQVPNTASRTLSADVTVRDRDTIVLGGFLRTSGTKTKSGVPILKDIPVMGALFRSSSSSKDRKELLVLMRPTVLKTPELAAIGSKTEERRMQSIYSFEKRLRQEDEEFQKKMDKLDGKKPEQSKTGQSSSNLNWDSPASTDDPQTEKMRQAVRNKQSEVDAQTTPVTLRPATESEPQASSSAP
ncbi:MAG: putative ral secretion pathway protein [Verrucomicrobiota bacterium]|jgi:general secretion pathway protein D